MTLNKKRSAAQLEKSSKRHKPLPKSFKSKNQSKGKDKAADRGVIPIPAQDDDGDLSDENLDILESYGKSVAFLNQLDHKGIARSKKETERLHQQNKPAKRAPADVDLSSVESHSDDDASWSSSAESSPVALSEDDIECGNDSDAMSSYSDAVMSYEIAPRKRHSPWQETEDKKGVPRLPIKLSDGRIQSTGRNAPILMDNEESSDSESDVNDEQVEEKREDVSTGARFGRAAVVDIIGTKSRKARVQAAKDQIAGICQDIIADPENSLGLLRRLHSFSLARISTPTHLDTVDNDPIVRKLAFLSQLAVFKDIIPGYRIRALTDTEKTEKVSQMVARTREWEQGLLIVYQTYLRSLEAEIKARSELSAIALNCMCTLLTEVTHFNFRINLMNCIVARLSKKSWDESSQLCLNSLIAVFRADLTGAASLEIVRLLNRMIKEKHFNVRPEVLGCLVHLRLKTELGTRASDSKADKDQPKKGYSKSKEASRRRQGKLTNEPHLSKKARKVLKEKKEIEREFREAEAEVDKEVRAVTHTETLKLLFVLYFKTLKHPRPTPLLPAALEGISKYAHLVNIDFFRDLMKVLKDLIHHEAKDVDGTDLTDGDVQHRLQCIVTAFELLSGQGEALNIDLADFITQLYALLPSFSLMPLFDVTSSSTSRTPSPSAHSQADMLFRALNIVFSPQTFGTSAPSWRSAAFAKRLLTASLQWPPAVTIRALRFVGGLLAKDSKLHALLTTEDRTHDGVYRPDVDDPQLCNPFGTSFWELYALRSGHWDMGVREEAAKVINIAQP